jgi:catechol 2,3-dioxygenase-like lactoylglutathione lyase family enzyme
MTSAKPRQFRFGYFTERFDETVAFYRDGLGLPVLESWDRDEDDRGILLAAGAGVIEVQFLSRRKPLEHVWDDRPPQGAFMAIETGDLEAVYRTACERGLAIQQAMTSQPWGHRSFCLREPNGLTLYIFSQG